MRTLLSQTLDQYLALIAGLAIGAGLVLMIGMVPFKWSVFLVGVAIGGSFFVLLGTLSSHLRGGMLFLAIIALPTFYGIDFLYREGVRHTVQANGYPLTLFDVLLVALAFSWLYEHWRNPRHPPLRFPPAWGWLLAGLLAINVFSAAFIARETFFAWSMVYTQIKGYLIVFLLANFLRSGHDFRVLGYAFAGVLLFETLVVIEQKLVGVIFTAENIGRHINLKSKAGAGLVERAAGTLAHPNDLAMYLNLALPWAIFMLISETRYWRRILLGAAVIGALSIEVLTGSRGGWLGLACAFTLCFFFWMRKRGQNPLIGLGTAAVVVAVLFAVMFASSSTFRVRLIEGDAGTAEVRYPLMDVAMEMIKENPVLGVGLNQYTREMVPYDRTNHFVAYSYNQPVHNTFLLVGAETGVPSLVLLAAFIWIAIRNAYATFMRSSGIVEAASLGVLGALISWLMHNQVNLTATFNDETLWVLFGVLAAGMYYRADQDPGAPSGPKLSYRG